MRNSGRSAIQRDRRVNLWVVKNPTFIAETPILQFRAEQRTVIGCGVIEVFDLDVNVRSSL